MTTVLIPTKSASDGMPVSNEFLLLCKQHDYDAQIVNGCMPAGVYRGMPEEIYNALPAVRSTYLKTLANESAAHAYVAMEDAKPPTDPMLFGTAWHTAFLEPESFPLRYVLWKGDKRGKKWKDFEEANQGKRILKEEDYLKCLAMAERLREHPDIDNLFKRGVNREASLLWWDKETGLWCKARLDAYVDDETPTLADLKSAACAREFEFAKAIVSFGYDIQTGMYCMGSLALRPGRTPNFIMIPSEKTPPFECNFFELDRRTLRVGWIRARNALNQFAVCLTQGVWPGYPHEIITLNAPEWHLKKYEDN